MRILLMPNFTKPRTWEVLRELCGRMEALGLTAAAVEKDYRPIAGAGIGPVDTRHISCIPMETEFIISDSLPRAELG